MNDAEFVQFLESLCNLPDDIESHLLIDLSCRAKTFEIATRTILHDEIDIVLCVDHLVELDYVGMTEFLHDGDFIVEGFFEIAIAADELLLDSLYGDLSALVAYCFVDLTE